ncbi:RNA polymerase II subunit RPB11, putative [Eimeria tenella]|uniref:RNA polymerase II subunit RPB11, putative n=1 Tax=Eimeria tenella TaxID=5802 RepID=U6L5C8_EIMTE|nr:RNA polymerase II subunit RPB11, putative [Eimeria tenella]CDJ45376.1 RNA polymerase II subunit RPB11, putative [Eimeria tenella]|eukprot:XP_013236122.1 RNA polymerase II subunit RPB11, putative [Eimeria tenella]
MSKQSSAVNRPDAADLLELPPGVHKVEWAPDLRFPLCGTFTLYLEDYTVGYLLRNDLLRDKRVKFVGLRQPHPLTASIELRIQAVDVSPLQLFLETVRRQRTSLTFLGALFKAAVDAYSSSSMSSSSSSSNLAANLTSSLGDNFGSSNSSSSSSNLNEGLSSAARAAEEGAPLALEGEGGPPLSF